ncbi:PQQ-dependent sugar dehydrogenase [Methylocystis sp. 9N]|uniref:PQQ-dependent sugar dehydrogenase n=1 Tax=Methylocystis borbori TaxID=3118750 RepID=A0ABU7XGZ9_9HYPH
MILANSSRQRAFAFAAGVAVSSLAAFASARAEDTKPACSEDAGLSLPKGFCATVFADGVGHARQLAVAPDGALYVNTWSGVYYGNDKPHDGGFLVALKDTKGAGKADVNVRFGPSFADGAHGGTGVWRYKNWIYAEANDKIVRYDIGSGLPAADARPEIVLSGMPIAGDHPMHPFAIDAHGNLFVSMGSATNACEVKNRMPHSPGNDPCMELETRAGVWRYDANKLGQTFSPNERYISGSRNSEGFDFDSAGRLFVTQHGRDQLHEDWPELFTAEQGFELPAEQMMMVKGGAWYGWPNCYFDPRRKKLVLAPEYGGDGGEKIGVCEKAEAPIAYYPAHWAPNDLKIYSGAQFPKAYSGGAFIAFHGSWNRAPSPQGGYNVAFQPLADGKPAGDYIVFADGFAGRHKDPGRAAHRPSGLAVAPDGALFISDDQAGRIWRVTYVGDRGAPIEAAPIARTLAASSPLATPPEGVHPDAGSQTALPVPPGSSAEKVALGKKVFHGEVGGATCAGCHGADGVGTPVGAALNTGLWLWSDGSLSGVMKTIEEGVAEPKQHPGAMPPLGGVELSKENLEAVVAYVWALGHAPNNR